MENTVVKNKIDWNALLWKFSYYRRYLFYVSLSLTVFVVDIGAHFLMNFMASDSNFTKERDKKLLAIYDLEDVKREKYKSDSLSSVLQTNADLMIRDNKKKVEWAKSINAAVNNAALLDTAYRNLVARHEKKILQDYSRTASLGVESFWGKWSGVTIGLLAPIFALGLASFSTRQYGGKWYERCMIGSYLAQFVSSGITAIAIYLKFGDSVGGWYGAIAFAGMIAFCAPLFYEGSARERKYLRLEYQRGGAFAGLHVTHTNTTTTTHEHKFTLDTLPSDWKKAIELVAEERRLGNGTGLGALVAKKFDKSEAWVSTSVKRLIEKSGEPN